jgi:hypothetical protein
VSASITYVACWDEVFDNTIHIENELIKATCDYLIINKSSFRSDSPQWKQANDTRYYGHFFDALKHFVEESKNSIFIFNAGDSRWPDISGYTKRIEDLLESDKSIGVLSPDQTNDPFTGSGSHIQDSKKHPGLYLCTLTNGIFVSMQREIAELTYDYMKWAQGNGVDFYKMTSGWGLDYIYSAASYMLDKKVYKDSTVKMFHPDGSGYNYDVAAKESNIVMESFIQYWANHRSSSHKVRSLFSVFMRKVHEKENYAILLKEVYLNGRQPAEV